jgi:hypothetical protein
MVKNIKQLKEKRKMLSSENVFDLSTEIRIVLT